VKLVETQESIYKTSISLTCHKRCNCYLDFFFFLTNRICHHILQNKVSGQGQKQEVQDPQYPKPDKSDLKQQPEQYKIVTGTTMSHSLHLKHNSQIK
jgi:hypothetical protein